jgi:acyl-CoA synthetase (AMP-forming)/AMP-acid ligase II
MKAFLNTFRVLLYSETYLEHTMSDIITPQPRLLVHAVDEKAENIPDSPWILYAKSSSWEQEGGYQTITWRQFGNAINKTARWLDHNLPRTRTGPQTLAYLGPNDPRYYILIVAAAKSKRRVNLNPITFLSRAKLMSKFPNAVHTRWATHSGGTSQDL